MSTEPQASELTVRLGGVRVKCWKLWRCQARTPAGSGGGTGDGLFRLGEETEKPSGRVGVFWFTESVQALHSFL